MSFLSVFSRSSKMPVVGTRTYDDYLSNGNTSVFLRSSKMPVVGYRTYDDHRPSNGGTPGTGVFLRSSKMMII